MLYRSTFIYQRLVFGLSGFISLSVWLYSSTWLSHVLSSVITGWSTQILLRGFPLVTSYSCQFSDFSRWISVILWLHMLALYNNSVCFTSISATVLRALFFYCHYQGPLPLSSGFMFYSYVGSTCISPASARFFAAFVYVLPISESFMLLILQSYSYSHCYAWVFCAFLLLSNIVLLLTCISLLAFCIFRFCLSIAAHNITPSLVNGSPSSAQVF